jgi:hypothetical protein
MRKQPKPDKLRKTSKDRVAEKAHLSDVLDEALEETFPASDTPSVIRPDHAGPAKGGTSEDR